MIYRFQIMLHLAATLIEVRLQWQDKSATQSRQLICGQWQGAADLQSA